MRIKGIVLAGGRGTRLAPLTNVISKQLLPIYDKPMIYYPLSTLMLAGCRDLVVITTPRDQIAYQELLGDGSDYGISIEYAIQSRPDGIAAALLVAEPFLHDAEAIYLILGDNLFHGDDFTQAMQIDDSFSGARILTYQVTRPEAYGVVEFTEEGSPLRIVEKPEFTSSTLAVTGAYMYDRRALDYVRDLRPSRRGELEITDLNSRYLDEGTLDVRIIQPGSAWLDTGSVEALHDASVYVRTIQNRQGTAIGDPRNAAQAMGWLPRPDLDQ